MNLIQLYKKVTKRYKQSKCKHCICENYLSWTSNWPKVRDNYCTYDCMLCWKQIKFLWKTANKTNMSSVSTCTTPIN